MAVTTAVVWMLSLGSIETSVPLAADVVVYFLFFPKAASQFPAATAVFSHEIRVLLLPFVNLLSWQTGTDRVIQITRHLARASLITLQSTGE